MIVGLLGCSARKRAHPCEAIDLYQGTLFKRSVAWLRRRYGSNIPLAILSARHGLLTADRIVAPYNDSFADKSRAELSAGASGVNADLRARFPGAHFVVCAGSRYSSALAGLPAEFPLAGLSIGRALSFTGKP